MSGREPGASRFLLGVVVSRVRFAHRSWRIIVRLHTLPRSTAGARLDTASASSGVRPSRQRQQAATTDRPQVSRSVPSRVDIRFDAAGLFQEIFDRSSTFCAAALCFLRFSCAWWNSSTVLLCTLFMTKIFFKI